MASARSLHRSAPRLLLIFLLPLATWCATRTGSGMVFAALAQKKVALLQLQDADLEQLKSMKSELEEKLRSIRLPAPTSVMAFGKEHPVPSTVEDPEEPSKDMVRYLSGHFAGSGSISSQRALLRVTESGADASNLLLFQKYFGGRVYVDRPGSGLSRPTIRWEVSSSKALRAAQMMGESQLPKQRQLLDMAEGRFGKGDDEQGKVAFQCWREVAGFLDVCMCLEASARGEVSMVVRGPQKSLLAALAEFFQHHLGVGTLICNCGGNSGLNNHQLYANFEAARPILAASLENGLLRKKKAAEAVLGWTKETHWEVRRTLQESKGNSKRFSRQDEDAGERSHEIKRLQGQLRRKEIKGADVDEIQPLQQKIVELVSNHKRLQQVEEIQRLQDHLETVQKQVATGPAAEARK